MTNDIKSARLRDRAARLRREASNCLTIAVHERDEGDAANLIDEAIRLARRSGELAGQVRRLIATA